MAQDFPKRADRFTIHRQLKYTCGWTSDELAWQAERDRRLWLKEHNPLRIKGDWIDKLTKGESSVQTLSEGRLEEYVKAVCKPTDLTLNIDGLLHDGDIVRLRWLCGNRPIYLSAFPVDVNNESQFLEPVRATGMENCGTTVRNSFHVFRNDQRVPSSVPLMYDECIYMCSTASTGKFLLHSEMKTCHKFAILSGNQEVCWTPHFSARTLWKARCIERRTSRQCKGIYIPTNTKIILNHVVTNQNLALEEDYKISTLMGTEYEISAKTYATKPNSDYNPSNAPCVSLNSNNFQAPMWMFEAPFHVY